MNAQLPTRTTKAAAEIITLWVRCIRPAWPEGAIMTALAARSSVDPGRLALAALAAAINPATPNAQAIDLDGPHWHLFDPNPPKTTADRHPSSVYVSALCTNCGRPEFPDHPSIRCETWEQYVHTATPQTMRQALATARATVHEHTTGPSSHEHHQPGTTPPPGTAKPAASAFPLPSGDNQISA